MLETTVDRTIAACRQLGLRSYDPDADAEHDLPRLIGEAWQRFLEQPGDYAAWEADRIETLAERL